MPLERLSKSVYARIYHDPSIPSDSNKGYVITDKYVVVIDTSYLLNNVRNDLKELRKITDREVGYVMNTHYHTDHVYGNGLFDCEIVAHSKCLELMKETKEEQLMELLQEVADPGDRKLLEGVRYPTILFEESYQLDSNPKIHVIHLAGHTPDLSVVYIPEQKILFASDNLFGSQNPSIPSHPFMANRSDLNVWIVALKKILKIDAKTIVPGHFGICNKEAVGQLIDYLHLFIRNVRELKRLGYSKEEAKKKPELLNLPKRSAERFVENNIETQYDKV